MLDLVFFFPLYIVDHMQTSQAAVGGRHCFTDEKAVAESKTPAGTFAKARHTAQPGLGD